MNPYRDSVSKRRARGSVYLFVLSVAVLVTGIGLSSLLVMRVERRTTDLIRAAAEARVAAASLLEVVLLRINKNPDWRNTYQNNVWEPNETIDNLVFTFKLVDEADNNLANDVSQPVRLYSKVTTGNAGAMRIYSVMLESPQVVNLLKNPGFEDGTTDWQSWNCTLVHSSSAYKGTGCVLLDNRGSIDATCWQDITNGIENGKSYYVEMWAKSSFSTEYITVSLKTSASSSGDRIFVTTSTAVDNWTRVSGFLTPTWSGTLSQARWRAFSYPTGGTRDFYIDESLMMDAGDLGMAPVPGTWCRKVLP